MIQAKKVSAKVHESLRSLQALRKSEPVQKKIQDLRSNLKKLKGSLRSIRERINQSPPTPPAPQSPQ